MQPLLAVQLVNFRGHSLLLFAQANRLKISCLTECAGAAPHCVCDQPVQFHGHRGAFNAIQTILYNDVAEVIVIVCAHEVYLVGLQELFSGKRATTENAPAFVCSVTTFLAATHDFKQVILTGTQSPYLVQLEFTSEVGGVPNLGPAQLSLACNVKCNFTCSAIHRKSHGDSSYLVAYGNSFGDLVVCNPDSDGDGSREIQVHSDAVGKGVIFDMLFLSSGNREQPPLLVTASDDRSIRLWTFQFSSDQLTCVARAYAHTTRPWVAVSTAYSCSADTSAPILITGASELCIWRVDLRAQTLSLLRSIESNCGEIRSVAVNDKTGAVAVGTLSGALNTFQLDSLLCSRIESILPTDQNDPVCSVRTSPCAGFLFTTKNGSLYQSSVDGECSRQESIGSESCRFMPSSLSVNRAMDRAAVACRQHTDEIYLLTKEAPRWHVVWFVNTTSQVVCSVVLVDSEFDCCGLVVCYKSGRVTFLWLDASLDLLSQYELQLPAGKHSWLTAAVGSSTANSVVTADRNGCLACYSLRDQSPFTHQPSHVLPGVHGRLGVSDVCRDPSDASLLHSIGRDGRCLVWRWLDCGQLSLLAERRVADGACEWPARFCGPEGDPTALLAGFHGENFAVYTNSVTAGPPHRLCSIACGGGHREWHLRWTGDGLQLVYIKQGRVHSVLLPKLLRLTQVQPAAHAQQVTCVAAVTLGAGGGEEVFVSGSIENSLCAWRLRPSEHESTPDDNTDTFLRPHYTHSLLDRNREQLSSVHAVAVRDGCVAVACARSELRVYACVKVGSSSSDRVYLQPTAVHRDLRAQCRYLDVAFVIHKLLAVARSDSQIWLFGFDASTGGLWPLTRRLLGGDGDGAFGCVTQVSAVSCDDRHLVSAVTSSSYLLIWQLAKSDADAWCTHALATCPTVRPAWRPPPTQLPPKLTSTDYNRVDFETDSLRPDICEQLTTSHRSGLAALDSVYVSAERALVTAVGSEAGAVSVHLWPATSISESSSAASASCVLQCHASTVTAIRVQWLAEAEQLATLSIALDQRLILCRLTDSDGLCIERCIALACGHPLQMSVTAETDSAETTSRNDYWRVVVAGAGFDVLHLPIPKTSANCQK